MGGFVNGVGTIAQLNFVQSVVFATNGLIYVGDTNNNRVRSITTAGLVATVAGSGTAASVDGVGTSASFNALRAVTVDTASNLYIAEYVGNKIRKLFTSGLAALSTLLLLLL